MVKVEILKQYTCDEKTIFAMTPNFEDIGIIEAPTEDTEEKYTENFHLEGVGEEIVQIYEGIKNGMTEHDPAIKVNPQKYYISLRKNRNFAYIQPKMKKIHIIIMLSYETGETLIKKHKLIQLSEGIQKFYGRPCFQVTLRKRSNLDEILNALREAYKLQS